MKRNVLIYLMFLLSTHLTAQQAPPKVSAGFPVNYSEDSIAKFSLPDLFTLSNGKKISTAKEWTEQRRPELLKLIEEIEYGKMPGRPEHLHFDIFDKGTAAFDGKAVRKQVTVYFTKDTADHKMDMLIYLPSDAKGPVPLLLNISFSAVNQLTDDPGVKIGSSWSRDGKKTPATEPSRFGKMNIQQFIDSGFGFAVIHYTDIEPDFKDGIKYGIRKLYLKKKKTVPADNEWGAISAWAWGLSRAMDYFETDKSIDAKRIAIQGASRLGKTVLWAGAYDTRFKMVIASISGEGGAAIARRNYGESIKHITDTSRYYYQFAPNYHLYSHKVDDLPFDAHMLVALMAPRPLLLQTGDTDYWSDPKGEFLSAVTASRVYELFGLRGPGASPVPAAGDRSLLMNSLGYYMHSGGHTVLPEDWSLFIKYMQRHL